MAEKLNTSTFKHKANIVHKGIFDYSSVEYINNRTKVTIICSIHGEFEQRPGAHLRGQGCPECGSINTAAKRTLSTTDFIEISKTVHGDRYNYSNSICLGANKKVKVVCPIHGTFLQTPNDHLQGAGCPQCCISPTSKAEKEINEYFQNIFETNSRKIISPKEIDLFSKEYKFGIEYNGSQFHSYGNSIWSALDNLDKIDKFKHQYKTNLMEEKGLQLFYIQESDWKTNRKQIWVSLINNKLGKSIKVGARKLKLYRVHENYRSIVNKFLDENHLQGAGAQYGIAYMLLDNDNIIHSVMTFGGIHNNTNPNYYELKRFCNRLGYNIMGAASRLLKAFENEFKPEYLLSYAKRDWSQGNLYEKIGFTFIGNTEPSMFYIKGNKRFSRQKFQKHKLHDLHEKGILENLNGSTAKEIMLNNGYRIYYDSGNKKYEKEYN